MFVPLHDTNPLEHIKFQFMTVLIIIANIVTINADFHQCSMYTTRFSPV